MLSFIVESGTIFWFFVCPVRLSCQTERPQTLKIEHHAVTSFGLWLSNVLLMENVKLGI